MTEQGFTADQIDTSLPHPARMYDYFLGGKDNYEVDREAADRVLAAAPEVAVFARANRAFLARAVRHLARSGVRQFIDIGTGIPTSPNTHEVAQAVDSEVRVAYIDNDPIVATHAGARLLGTGNTGFFLGDMRDPSTILGHPTIGELIDVQEPIAVLLVSVLHFVGDADDPAGLLAAYRRALPPGSFLVLSHATADFHREEAVEVAEIYKNSTAPLTPRTHAQVLDLFAGFELVEPGLVQVHQWRPDEDAAPHGGGPVGVYGGIGKVAGGPA
ncbi:SAM-dependent methyltransferase [Actinacidiphila sp. DG2A-62]|uniref:SAM-dependent methyltransferase n=1 Tax=Actinacidiphila sp. DG2A-62 TaxID=3108821 RepID=UPI002DB71C23|nr:SAM-dependent methyltransferase [Actinacidiphila sp. DG2A-62]MEC3997989.1 SAM-dependent methyltransferase [Actinacidiphila sp. DG2A-62]